MNRSAHCYYESALKYFLPVELHPEINGFTLMLGKKNYYFSNSWTPLNNNTSTLIANDKYTMNRTLSRAGLPVPKAHSIHITEFENGSWIEKISDLTFPLVAKPQIGSLGKDVLCNIQNFHQLTRYMEQNLAHYKLIVVEEFHGNLNSYRVLIFNNRVTGIVRRYPASVCGDGQHSIRELVELTNIQRKAISNTLSPIVIDAECQNRLDALNLHLESIPAKGEQIMLGFTSNASRGGWYCSLKNRICKKNRQLLIRAARVLNLQLVGFDVECVDINVPMESSGGVIIESNVGPSLRIHEYPVEGRAVKVSRKIIRSLIYRHPLAYLKILSNNPRTSVYMRSLILLLILSAAASYGLIR